MHSMLAAGFFSLLTYIGTEDQFSAESCAIGYISHLALDTLTPSGVPLLFPLSNSFSLSLTYANSLKFNSAIIALSVGLMLVKKNTEVFRPFLKIL